MEMDKDVEQQSRRWLVPVDCGLTSETALRHTLELARGIDKIVILCLIEQLFGRDQEEILKQLKDKYEEILQNAHIAPDNISIETVEPICPREYICEYARAIQADYIVMDSLATFRADKGGEPSIISQFAVALFGSRRVERFTGVPNEQVLHNSPCPIIFVRNYSDQPTQKKTKKKVWLVAVDGGAQSKKALKHVVSLMNPKDRLILLKIISDNLGGVVPSKELLMSDLGGSEEQEEALRFTRELSSELREMKINHSVKLKDMKRTDNEVGEVILEQVLERNVDYIAMGTNNVPGLARMLGSSASDYCVRNAVCPVLLTTRRHEPPKGVEAGASSSGGSSSSASSASTPAPTSSVPTAVTSSSPSTSASSSSS